MVDCYFKLWNIQQALTNNTYLLKWMYIVEDFSACANEHLSSLQPVCNKVNIHIRLPSYFALNSTGIGLLLFLL